jgi:MFS family permease
MKRMMKTVALFLAVVVGGYLVIALLQTLVLEVALGGAVDPHASIWVLGLATAGTVVSGLIGGFLVARIDRAHPLRHVAGVVCVLAFDTVFVIANASGADPVWFSLGGALTLMAATALGGWIGARPRR